MDRVHTKINYPSAGRVNWSVTSNGCVLVEVLWNREAHEYGKPQDKFCPETIQIAELHES